MNLILHEAIRKFIGVAQDVLPDICINQRMYSTIVYDDYALLPYALPKPRKIEEIKECIQEREELKLYYFIKNEFGQYALCAYSNPVIDRMFKLNAITENGGYVFDINITVYDSLEFMSYDLMEELSRAEKREIIYKREKGLFLTDFT